MWSIIIFSIIILLLFAIQQTLFLPSPRTFFLFRKLPGPINIPLLGVALELYFTEPWGVFDVLKKYMKIYPDLLCTYIFGAPVAILTNPEHIKEVLSSTQHINKGIFYSFFKTWLMDGVITSTGDKWVHRRKLLVSSLHMRIIADNMDIFWYEARQIVDSLLKHKNKRLDINAYIYPSALNIICETAMGVSMNEQKQENRDYTNALMRTQNAVLYRILNPYLNREWLWKFTSIGSTYTKDVQTLHGYSEKVIRQRSEHRSENEGGNEYNCTAAKGKGNPVLDRLLDEQCRNPNYWKMEDILEEVNGLIFANERLQFIKDDFSFVQAQGHDTTSITASFALWMLGLNPEIQEKAYEEMYDIFGDNDHQVTMNDLNRMHYLDKIIKETLRKFPPIPIIMRTLAEDLQLDGFPVIPSRCNVMICPVLLHQDERTFPEPNVFNPERFTPEEVAKRHPYSYIPFSAGPRNCIGKKFAIYELKVVLSTVIRFCRIKSITREEDVKLIPSVTLQPKPILEVVVEQRKEF